MWSPFVLSKQTESQLADFTQLFFGQALRSKECQRYEHAVISTATISTMVVFARPHLTGWMFSPCSKHKFCRRSSTGQRRTPRRRR
ncbi:hypothetical protein ELH43_39820 [Rhizobium ruizarguesonis]|nr:hypothetical protein ELH43_39820 [Rhizobium ruizarguesonis]